MLNQSPSGVSRQYLEIDIKELPILWWETLRLVVNDYLQYSEGDPIYQESVHWLFTEDFHPVLDGEKADVMSFHVIAEVFEFDIDKFRFELQLIRDVASLTDKVRDPRGRKNGFLSEKALWEMIERCKRKD